MLCDLRIRCLVVNSKSSGQLTDLRNFCRCSVLACRGLVSSRIKYISLVNLILDAPLVTELIQQDLNFDRLNHEFSLITVDADNRQRIAQGYSQLYSILGNAGASDHTADAIISTIKQSPIQHN